MRGSEVPLEARHILARVADMITLSPRPSDPYFRSQTLSSFADGYKAIFSKHNHRFVLTTNILTTVAFENGNKNGLRAAISDKLAGMFETVSGIMIPDTSTPMFREGGGFSLFSTDTGSLQGYTVKRGTSETLWGTLEAPMHHDPYLVSKPFTLGMLQALGENPEISDPKSYAVIDSALDLSRKGSFVHMGGKFVNLALVPGADRIRMIMAASSFDYTEDMRDRLKKTLEEISPLSIDPSTDNDPSTPKGYYTAAGFGDQNIVIETIQAYEDGKRGDELQEVTNRQIAYFYDIATNPGPIPGSFH